MGITKSSGRPAPAIDPELDVLVCRELFALVELPIDVAPELDAVLGLPDVAMVPAFTELRSVEPAEAAAWVDAAELPPREFSELLVKPDSVQLFSCARPGAAEPAEPSEFAALVTEGEVGDGLVGEDVARAPEPLPTLPLN